MNKRSASLPCYLVEWYRPELTQGPLEHTAATLDEWAAWMSVEGDHVALLSVLAVPTDEVLFGIFAADSADIVAQTCRRAGMPAERLTPAVDTHIAR